MKPKLATQLEMPEVSPASMILTPHGKMRVSSLRPGDYLVTNDGNMKVRVQINSAKLAKTVILWPCSRYEDSIAHWGISLSFRYIGHEKPRRWVVGPLRWFFSPVSAP